jgi:hypothetical protein
MRKGRKLWLPAFQISPRTWPFFAVTFFYGCFDKVLRGNCHEIFGDIAMQHAQFYFGKPGTKRRLAYALLLGLANPCLAGTIAHPTPRDPLLDGGAPTGCAQAPDYVDAQDTTGKPVAPADVSGQAIPVPDSLTVPLHADSRRAVAANRPQLSNTPYINLDGKKLAPLLNPPPCH